MSKSESRWVLVVCCAAFFVLGLTTAVLGPALPELAGKMNTSLAQVGGLFTALFLGALSGQLIAGPLSDRIGQRPVIVTGMLLIVAGTLGLTFSRSLAAGLAFALLAGLGHGPMDLGINVLVARIFARRSVSALNLLNLFFGVGAFTGPAAAGFSFRLFDSAFPVIWITAAAGLLILPLLARIPAPQGSLAGAPVGAADGVLRSPLIWLLGLLILVYVGVENGIGGWTTAIMQRTVGMDLSQAALITSFFWLALTAGRLAWSVAGNWLTPVQVLLVSLGGASAAGLLSILGLESRFASVAGVVLTGLCFGAIYPTTMALVSQLFQRTPGKAVSMVASAGSVGGMLLPWLQGVLLERSGPLPAAWFVGAGIWLMLGFILVVRLLSGGTSRQSAVEAPQKV